MSDSSSKSIFKNSFFSDYFRIIMRYKFIYNISLIISKFSKIQSFKKVSSKIFYFDCISSIIVNIIIKILCRQVSYLFHGK